MGMYTMLSLGVDLVEGVPDEVLAVLGRMTFDRNLPKMPYDLEPDHEFFKCPRWAATLRCDSYYFDWTTNFQVYRDDLYKDRPRYNLTGCSNLKNYDGEIAKFILWLAPYIDTMGFLGFTMYEEQSSPTLIYKIRDQIVFTKAPCVEHMWEEKDVDLNVPGM